jgi:hypothetical protein
VTLRPPLFASFYSKIHIYDESSEFASFYSKIQQKIHFDESSEFASFYSKIHQNESFAIYIFYSKIHTTIL